MNNPGFLLLYISRNRQSVQIDGVAFWLRWRCRVIPSEGHILYRRLRTARYVMTKLEETRLGNLRQKEAAEKLTIKEQNWLKCLSVKKSVETEASRLHAAAQGSTIRMRQEHY